MLTKRCVALILCLLLVFSLAACSTQAPATDPSDSTPPTDGTPSSYESYMEELHTIEAFLNDRANNGFVSNNLYTSPSEIDLYRVFYDGAGIKQAINQWAEAEAQAVLNATGWQATASSLAKIPYEAANAFLLEKCGLSFTDFPTTEQQLRYVEAYDAIYLTHTGLNYHRINVTIVHIEDDGRRTVYYTIPDCTPSDHTQRPANYIATLQKTDSGYQFISNVENLPPKPEGIEEPFLSVLTGQKTFYHATHRTNRHISYYKRFVLKYVCLDIDADGKKELVFTWDSYGDHKDLLILREENGSAVGYDLSLTDLASFNKDGSYIWVQANVNARIQGRSVLRFSGSTYTSTELWRYEQHFSGPKFEYSEFFYYVKNKSVSEEEFNTAVAGAACWAEWDTWILD